MTEEKATTFPVDFLCRPIDIGVRVVYARRRGSSMWLTTGIVRDLRWVGYPHFWVLDVAAANENGKVRIGRGVPASRCVVVTA